MERLSQSSLDDPVFFLGEYVLVLMCVFCFICTLKLIFCHNIFTLKIKCLCLIIEALLLLILVKMEYLQHKIH